MAKITTITATNGTTYDIGAKYDSDGNQISSTYIKGTEKGAASGVAELDSSGKVPTSQLPSYVDDVLEYTNKASFPSSGETGKIYVDLATNLTYRWSGTAYVEISPSLALGETSSTAYRGDYGAAAYAHGVTNKGSAFTSGFYKITTNSEGHVTNAIAVQKSDITGLGIPGSDTNTTYTFEGGTNKFTVTPSGGSAQDVTVTPSITNNITGSGTSGYLTKFDGTNTITDGPQLGSDTTKYLRNDGTWVVPPDNNTTYTFEGGTNKFTVTPSNGTATDVTITPSIANNVTGSGTSGYIAKFNGANTITDGPAFGSDTTKYLRNDGTWVVPPDTTYTPASETPLMDSTGAVGTSTKYAREDHVHPSDTSRVPTSRKVNNKALSADITLSASDVSAVATSAVGAASGVASLDSNGLVPNSQLPCDVVNTVTLATADWTLDSTSGYYVQTETVSGMTANSHPDAKIKYPSGTTELTKEIIDEAANLLVEMVTAANSVSFYAVSAPTSALTIYLKGV